MKIMMTIAVAVVLPIAAGAETASPSGLREAARVCSQHYHLTGGGPVSTRARVYDTGFEDCPKIEAANATEVQKNMDQSTVRDVLKSMGRGQ